MMVEWTDALIAKLTRLWNEGHSCGSIAKMLGVSKSVVVGKAHRLKLPPRLSPIIRIEVGVADKQKSPSRKESMRNSALSRIQAVPVAVAETPLVAAAAVRVAGAFRPCCWPIGDPRTPEFRFCNEAQAPGMGKPYCARHRHVSTVGSDGVNDGGEREMVWTEARTHRLLDMIGKGSDAARIMRALNALPGRQIVDVQTIHLRLYTLRKQGKAA